MMRVIAKTYRWTPTEMMKLNAADLSFWFDSAKACLEGRY